MGVYFVGIVWFSWQLLLAMVLVIVVCQDFVLQFHGLLQRRVGVSYALRVYPAVTRLTVHRQLQVIPGRMSFGLICRLRNLVPGDRTEAISRNLIITIV